MLIPNDLPPLVPESIVHHHVEKRRSVAAGRFGEGGSDVVGVHDLHCGEEGKQPIELGSRQGIAVVHGSAVKVEKSWPWP